MSYDISLNNLYKRQNLPAIMREVTQLYEAISIQIHDTHKSGKSELVYELPDTFAIENYSLADLQLIIYSSLISKISDRGLTVKYIPNKGRGAPSLRITWPSILDPAEKEKMRNIILAHMEN